MLQHPLPIEISNLSPVETDNRIADARRRIGDDLIILGHHYQRDEIIKWADYRGDSLKLSQIAAQHPECSLHYLLRRAFHGRIGGYPNEARSGGDPA